MQVNYIVTHGGRSHADDYISVAVMEAVLSRPVPVYRRDPTNEELEDPHVLVLDVGGRYEIEKNNFDHHQMGRGVQECTLSLLCRRLKIPTDWWPWYSTMVIQDAQGLRAAAEAAGMTVDQAAVWLNPIVSFHLRRFSKTLDEGNDVDKGNFIGELRDFGRFLLEAALGKEKVYNDLKSKLPAGEEVVHVDGQPDPLVMKRLQKELGFLCNIADDDRGEGLSIFSYDTEVYDLSTIADDPRVVFAHKNGFLAKLKPISVGEAIQLAQQARVPDAE